MRATLLLADHAVVADGKLYINGGGWSVTGPGAPSAIAVKLDVPWDRANQRLHLRLRLIGQDGEPVTLPGPQGPQPIEITGDAEIGRPAGLVHGADIDFPLAFQIGPLPLQARAALPVGARHRRRDRAGLAPDLQHPDRAGRAGDVRRRSLTGNWNLVRHVRPTAASMREPLCLRGRMNSAALDDSGSCRALSPISVSAPTCSTSHD